MRKEFLVERQGRTVVLYSGLLDLAHQQGLRSIRTELLQLPTAETNHVAVCMATITLEQDGVERVFTGIADASPANVAPAMQKCLIRMSETRAKARALRDAVNVGHVALEELDEEEEAPRQNRPRMSAPPSPNPQGQRRETNHPVDPNALATDGQRKAIASICRNRDLQPPDMVAMTEAQASEWIQNSQRKGARDG